jgi:hypothetical protein
MDLHPNQAWQHSGAYDPAGRYLFPDNEVAMSAIRKLSARNILRVDPVDLREDQPQEEGIAMGNREAQPIAPMSVASHRR